ncbi:MAG: DUF4149 domain-containing protein [Elusimicrobia bacterium]|nr:DUF4149 domain-containing protein [Elusimicrobiota bacterium]
MDALIHWLHVMAAVVWVGSMIFTSLVLQPIFRKTLAPEVRMPIYHEMSRRYRWVQWICLAVLFATGIEKLWGLRHVPEVFHSPFGRVLGVKLFFVLCVIVLSYLHSYVWGPRLTVLSREAGSQAFHALTNKLIFWGRINLVLSIGVVFLAVLLRFSLF